MAATGSGKFIQKAMVDFLRGDSALTTELGHTSSDIRIGRSGKEQLNYTLPFLSSTLASITPDDPFVDTVYRAVFFLTAFSNDEVQVMDVIAMAKEKLQQDSSQVDADLGDTNVRCRSCRVMGETGPAFDGDTDVWQMTLTVELVWDRA